MSKHTPGPWTLNNQELVGDLVTAPCHEHVECYKTIVFGQGAYKPLQCSTGPNSLENARLIAAAPDLLAVSVEAENWLDHHGGNPRTDSGLRGLLEMLRAAISKAGVERVDASA